MSAQRGEACPQAAPSQSVRLRSSARARASRSAPATRRLSAAPLPRFLPLCTSSALKDTCGHTEPTHVMQGNALILISAG